jgi:hypothetical protein
MVWELGLRMVLAPALEMELVLAKLMGRGGERNLVMG